MMQTRGDKEKGRRSTGQSVTRLISRGTNAYVAAGMPMQSKSPAVSPSLPAGGVVQRQQEEDEVDDTALDGVAEDADVVQRQVMPGVTAHLPAHEAVPQLEDEELEDEELVDSSASELMPTFEDNLQDDSLDAAAESSSRDDEPVEPLMPEDAPYLKDTEPVEPIQRKEAPQQDALSHLIRQEAQHGVRTPSSGLPYAQQVQKAFGRHDVSHIQAHLGEKASASAMAMNAAAYATGNHVVFAGEPDLHTVAHEAAHVVQQQSGVQLAGGTGKVGDVYEQHANAVANQVVAGQPAEALLDQFAGQTRAPSQEIQSSPSAPEAGGVVQRVHSFSAKLRKKILAANKKKNGGLHTCTHCGLSHSLVTYLKKTGGRRVGDGGFHVDHIKPKSKGGKGTLKNGRVLCGTCNTSRGNRKTVGVTGYSKYRGLDGKKKLKVLILKEYARRKKNWDKKGTPVVK